MDRIERFIRMTAYIVVTFVCLFQGYRLITQPKAPDLGAQARALVGHPFALAAADWQKNGTTLVFAMSTSCHFCTASAPFYQKLTHEVLPQEHGRVKTIAVLPESRDAAAEYIHNTLGAEFDTVAQARTAVPGTPTLLLVNSHGVVTKAWLGLLTPEQQGTVIAGIRAGA